MKTKQVCTTIVCLFFFLALLSCAKKVDQITEFLQKAEQCMEAQPDSALSILQRIPNPQELQGKNQADYGLLMTQALDKNYKPLESDSLIQLAIRYYENSSDNVSKGKAYFYYGRYLYDSRKYEESLDVFLKSKRMLDNSKEYKLLGSLAYLIGSVNRHRHIYNEALLNYKESLEYYDWINDTLSITIAMRGIGWTYFLKNEVDSAFYYYTSALKIASDKELKSESFILHDLGIISRKTGNYEKAESLMLTSIDKLEIGEIYTRYLSLGILYFQMGKYDKAEEFLNKSLISPKPENHSNAYSYLYKISLQKGDYENVINYFEKCDSIRSLLMDRKNWSYALELQKKYDNEKLKNENLQIRNNRNSISLLGVIFILIVLIIAIYYYYRNYHNKKRIEDIERTISQNHKEIEDYKIELSGYTESKADRQNEMGELIGKITLLTNQNRDLTERLLVLGHDKVVLEESETESGAYTVALRTLLSIKNGTLNRKLSDHDIDQLVKLFNFLYNGYIDRLIEKFPGLTKHEIELCCLLKLQFTNQDLCNVSNATLESVRKSKTRLKSALGVPADETLEEFLVRF
ncbi:tetratricopeptide repeat protein [Bacteroides sp. 51]|uniref:tetratricopeptide repeat protein n=1 Tax=Bacteroides sp. 51 TaxID=2302938 RepID=UPI0013D46637|nr:tetratricopeptide repeat protein [Bacteroides sp. 51]NDV83485.1 tetratricopeptide repeat protein [Bacteroides sp. 51]